MKTFLSFFVCASVFGMRPEKPTLLSEKDHKLKMLKVAVENDPIVSDVMRLREVVMDDAQREIDRIKKAAYECENDARQLCCEEQAKYWKVKNQLIMVEDQRREQIEERLDQIDRELALLTDEGDKADLLKEKDKLLAEKAQLEASYNPPTDEANERLRALREFITYNRYQMIQIQKSIKNICRMIDVLDKPVEEITLHRTAAIYYQGRLQEAEGWKNQVNALNGKGPISKNLPKDFPKTYAMTLNPVTQS